MLRRLHRRLPPADYSTAYIRHPATEVFDVETGNPMTLIQQNQTANMRAQKEKNTCTGANASCTTTGGRRERLGTRTARRRARAAKKRTRHGGADKTNRHLSFGKKRGGTRRSRGRRRGSTRQLRKQVKPKKTRRKLVL